MNIAYGKICGDMCIDMEMNKESVKILFAKGEKKTLRQRNVTCGVCIWT